MCKVSDRDGHEVKAGQSAVGTQRHSLGCGQIDCAQLLHVYLHTSTVVAGFSDLPAQQSTCAATAGAGYLQQLSHCTGGQALTLPQQVGVGAPSACYPALLPSLHRARMSSSTAFAAASRAFTRAPRLATFGRRAQAPAAAARTNSSSSGAHVSKQSLGAAARTSQVGTCEPWEDVVGLCAWGLAEARCRPRLNSAARDCFTAAAAATANDAWVRAQLLPRDPPVARGIAATHWHACAAHACCMHAGTAADHLQGHQGALCQVQMHAAMPSGGPTFLAMQATFFMQGHAVVIRVA